MPTPLPPSDGGEAPFYIPATGTPARPRRTLKSDDTFAVIDSYGDIGVFGDSPDGVFSKDTRYLSRFSLAINGLQPLLLGSHVRDDNGLLTVDVTNSDIYFNEKLILPKDTIHVVRSYLIRDDRLFVRLGIQNHDLSNVDLSLSISFANDFADLFEARGMRRISRGHLETPEISEDTATLKYIGLDDVLRFTTLHFNPTPEHLGRNIARFRWTLAGGERRSILISIGCNRRIEGGRNEYVRALRQSIRSAKRFQSGSIAVGSSSDVFNEVLFRSKNDLMMLTTDTPQGRYPYAGTPWYSTTFGRDGIITALHMLWCDPDLAKGVLQRLAALQAKAIDPSKDAQPGKILHEMRAGEMANLREVPFGLYYGSVDSTPLFVLLAGSYAQRTGDYQTIQTLWPNIEAALSWIEGFGDQDEDGFVEYERATNQGLANQGWKDSYDSIFHADGQLAIGPIALAEVQAYVYAAKVLIAVCARKLGFEERALELEKSATNLAQKFDEAFWCDDIQTYAIALDGEKKPCRVRSSNAGHVLFAGLARPDRARIVANGLLSPRFMSGFGVRTIAMGEARYNPMSYHNGSIWPHDNAVIAMGLAKYGFKREANSVFSSIAAAASYMDLRRLPELFCGFKRIRAQAPTLYPVACSPQAWACSTPFAFLQASLGIEFYPDDHRMVFRNPSLPPFLDMLVLRNLELCNASVDVGLYRYDDRVSLEVLRGGDEIEVSTLDG